MKRSRYLLVLLVLILSAAVVYAQFSKDYTQEFESNKSGQALMQVFGALESNYLHKDKVDPKTLLEGGIQGMVKTLGDPFTYYFTPSETARNTQDQSGSFEGIGAELQALDPVDRTHVQIVNVFKGSPAWNAGLQRGDIFHEVNGKNVDDATIDDIVDMVRGPKGTTVKLGMTRPGVDHTVYFSVVRGTIKIYAVESTMLPQHVGYVSLSTFEQRDVYDELVKQVDALKQQGMTSLILDLRDNGGGFLDQGILVADAFLKQGDIVFQRQGGVTRRLAAADPKQLWSGPMVVLVNRYSASASEIVSGALQDNHRALIVGEQTFGKGVGQNVIPLADGSQLVYVTFEWLTPDRKSIARNNKENIRGGITPDVKATDTRTPHVITLQGQGAAPGQQITISVGGKKLGTAKADDEGKFTFFQPVPTLAQSAVQGQALVNLDTDNALKAAYNTVLKEVTATGAPSSSGGN